MAWEITERFTSRSFFFLDFMSFRMVGISVPSFGVVATYTPISFSFCFFVGEQDCIKCFTVFANCSASSGKLARWAATRTREECDICFQLSISGLALFRDSALVFLASICVFLVWESLPLSISSAFFLSRDRRLRSRQYFRCFVVRAFVM